MTSPIPHDVPPPGAVTAPGAPTSWGVEERLRLIVEASETGLWTWDLASGAVTWSAECHAIHGVPPEQFDGTERQFFRLVHPHDRERVQATVRAAIEGRSLYDCEFRIVRPDGAIRWVTNRGRARYDEQGRCTSVLGTITDITGRKSDQQAMEVALAASRTGTFRWDIQSDELWWDHALDRLFGLVPGEAVRSLEQFITRVHPDEQAEVIERCRRCKEHGDDFEMEFRVVHPDGTVRWLYDRGRTLFDADGRPRAMTGACVDVTERRLAEAGLRASESFYRRTLESVPGMTFTTLADGYCDYLSDQWRAYLGGTAETYLGHQWVLALHPDDRDRASRLWQDAVRQQTPYVAEYRMRRHDGAYRWFRALAHRISEDGAEAERWIGSVTDVHELKEAQARLAERERELRSITDNSPDVIVRFDPQLRHVFINAAIERLTGKPMALFLGRTNRELGMPAALCDHWETTVRKVFDERRPVTAHFDFEVAGSVRHFATRLVPEIGPSGTVDHVLGVTRDVTDAWQAQEVLRRADRQKDEFLATLAHELRNPLAPLRTGLSVLQRSPGRAEDQRVRQIMERQLDHMVRLVDELLDIARISQGKVVLRREVLPLATVLEHAVDAGLPLLEAQGHALVWDGVDPTWLVHGDITRLAQVVGNLLSNAAKYTPPGGRVTLSAVEDGSDLRITVEDTGMGIPRELLGRVFERFVQAEQHLERAQGGLGIGLNVVRALAEMHGGRASAESAGPGLGSRFHVWLPRAHERPAPIEVRQPASLLPAVPKRVLIVDDNQDAAETLAMVVQFHGHEIRVASDGPSALSAAREHQPDIVFLDIGMPGMSGYEVATQLRALPGWSNRVLVALTGWGTQEDRARSLAAGFDVHLTKPVELHAVESVLASARPGPLH